MNENENAFEYDSNAQPLDQSSISNNDNDQTIDNDKPDENLSEKSSNEDDFDHGRASPSEQPDDNEQEPDDNINCTNNRKKPLFDPTTNEYFKAKTGDINVGDIENVDSVNIKQSISKETNINKDININVKNFFMHSDEIDRNPFSLSRMHKLNTKMLISKAQNLEYPEIDYSALLKSLISKRVLLLTGQQDTGRFYLSKCLAASLLQQTTIQNVYYTDALSNQILIDLIGMIEQSDEIHNNVIIFKDALFKNNQGILDFILKREEHLVDDISEKLKRTNTFIIFTLDLQSIERCNLSHYDRIVKPDKKMLVNFLQKSLDHLDGLTGESVKNIAALIVNDFDKQTAQFTTMSQVNKFINLLSNYLSKNPDKTPLSDEAVYELIEQVTDIKTEIESWYFSDIKADINEFEKFKLWLFVFCLTLFHGSPYLFFMKLYNEIGNIFLSNKNIYQSDENQDTLPNIMFSESDMIKKSKACKSKNEHGVVIIEFEDIRYREIMYQLLIKNDPYVLSLLEDYLSSCAQHPQDRNSRLYSAKVLGRIGEIDPNIIYKYVKQWSKSEKKSQKSAVGYLYEGILCSNDKMYKSNCLNFLKKITFGTFNEKQTAIAAYKQIGLHNLELAIGELKTIIEENNASINQIAKQTNKMQMSSSEILSIIIGEHLIQSEVIFLFIKYSIIALAVMREPIDVICELNKWQTSKNDICKIMMVILLLDSDGIIDAFHKKNNQSGDKRSTSILKGLTPRKDSAEIFGCFLFFCMDNIKYFPTSTHRRIIRDSFWKQFKLWITENAASENNAKIIAELVFKFHQKANSEYRDRLWQNLKRWNRNDARLDFVINLISKKLLFA